MGKILNNILAALFLFVPVQAFCWGSVGHRTVGIIAEGELKPETKLALKRLLSFYTLADVASWADSIKDEGTYPQTSPYHFESVPDSKSFLETLKSLSPKEQKKGGVVTAILFANQVLRNPTATLAEQAAALRFLVHFVGDIHQPLHSGRPGDMGGLKIKIKWYGDELSLHQVWDSGMIEYGHRPLFSFALEYKDRAEAYAKFILARPMPPVVDTTMNVEAWLNEAIAFRPGVYDAEAIKDPKTYMATHLPTVDQAIYAAGIRLGALLNDIYAHNGITPDSQQQFTSEIEAILGTSLQNAISFAK